MNCDRAVYGISGLVLATLYLWSEDFWRDDKVKEGEKVRQHS
jgi:hypothetical protein